MAGVALNSFLCHTSPQVTAISKGSLFPTKTNLTGVCWNPAGNSNSSSGKFVKGSTDFKLCAARANRELKAPAIKSEKSKDPTECVNLKKALIDSFYGTDRGLSASSETRAEIVELITQLEARNPTPAPTEALTLLNGKWILLYTSFVGLFPLLSRGALALVNVDEISQIIDSLNFTVQNCIKFSNPLATTSLTTDAKFEVRSPLRVQIKFEEGAIGTPELSEAVMIPESVDLMGQKMELGSLKGVGDAARKMVSRGAPLKFKLGSRKAESWLLTTYLDEEVRISRGDGGSVFVFLRDTTTVTPFTD